MIADQKLYIRLALEQQNGGQGLDVGDQQQSHNAGHDLGPHGLGNGLDGNLGLVLDVLQLAAAADGHEQVDAHGRRDLADSEVHGRQHAEVDGINAQLGRHRLHDGDEDVHVGVGVHEAAGDQEDHIYDQKEGKLVMCNASKKR